MTFFRLIRDSLLAEGRRTPPPGTLLRAVLAALREDRGGPPRPSDPGV